MILLLILPVLDIVVKRLCWLINKELFINLYIGQTEFNKYIQSLHIKERLKV